MAGTAGRSAAAGQRRPARPKTSAKSKAASNEAAMEAAVKGVLDDLTHDELTNMGPREGLLRMMRGALRAGALPLFIDIATALMPYMHAKKAAVSERAANPPTAEEIAADGDPDMAA